MDDATATSVLLVDDHAVIAAPLAMALGASGFRVVTADPGVTDDDGIVAAAERERPDVVLLDVHLGGGRLGTALVGPLAALGATVVLFTATRDAALLGAGLRAGAAAVVDKATPFDRLVAALHDLAAGRPAMPPEERTGLLAALDSREAEERARLAPFEALTERERHVLGLLIEGRSPKQIARSEGVSISTVRGHIRGVLSKLDVSSQREALAMARAAGWPGRDGQL
jgi:two-component system nitrate/nitrite response regulator NarL